MSGRAHKRTEGHTFLVRQRGKVRVDTSAEALMLPYELDESHEVALDRWVGHFPVAFGFCLVDLADQGRGGSCEENACSCSSRTSRGH